MNADNWSSPVFYVGHMIDFKKTRKNKNIQRFMLVWLKQDNQTRIKKLEKYGVKIERCND